MLPCPHCGQSPPSLWPHKEGSREDGGEALLSCLNPSLGHWVQAGLLVVGQAVALASLFPPKAEGPGLVEDSQGWSKGV